VPWPPDMVLAPLDSRNFPEQGEKNEITATFCLSILNSFLFLKKIDYHRRDSKKFWNQHCVGIVAKFALHELGYTVQPRPYVAKVDLAAVFFARPKMLAENIFFGKWYIKSLSFLVHCLIVNLLVNF
jgi:hypothetical protein